MIVGCLSDGYNLFIFSSFPLALFIFALFTHVPHLEHGQVSPFYEWVTSVVLMDVPRGYDTATCPILHVPSLHETTRHLCCNPLQDILQYSCNGPHIYGNKLQGGHDVLIHLVLPFISLHHYTLLPLVRYLGLHAGSV